jgi:WD40 repeat protein
VQDSAAGYDVFLSYSRADAAAADTLRARLREAGLSAFLDRYSLPAGQPWQPWLERHLGTCGALVALLGPRGISEWQHREIQLGVSRQSSAAKAEQMFAVIPALLPGLADDDVPVGRFLNLNTYVDLRHGLDDPQALQRLVAGAQGKALDEDPAQKLLAGLTPYRGLMPFREQDAGLFFGRNRFVDELVRKVGQRTPTNVVAVVGRSGSGKSSIVYAGLFPTLRRERGLSGQSVWQILDLRPYDEPLHQLAAAFDPPKDEQGSLAYRAALNEGAKLFRERKATLAELIGDRLRLETGSTRLLLYVDQWEELYTQATSRWVKSDDDRRRAADAKLFVDLMLEAAATSACTLVLSVRSDFYPDIQRHDGLRVAVQESQVSLGTMNGAELRDVIEGPSRALGASVDAELTKKLSRDIGLDPASGRSDEYDIGKLPLLEYAFEQAWAKRTCPRIGLESYSGLEQALEERANALYGRLSAEEQAAAKRLFVSLVTPGEGREDTRARIDIPADDAMRRVVQPFAGGEARLVVTDEAGGRRSVEVSHEALIRHWDKLRAWIDENRDKLRTREFLKANRAEWLKRNRDPSLLELPSQYVAAARSLYGQREVVIDDIKDYIEALQEHDRQRKEAEADKQREELEKVQRLAAAERQAKEAAEEAAQEAAARATAEFERAEAAQHLADERAKSEETERRLRRQAEEAACHADEQRTVALQNESTALTALSSATRAASPALAAKFALAAWPRNSADPRPKFEITIRALSAAISELRERKVLRGHVGEIRSGDFSPSGTQIVTASLDRTARLWDASTGKEIAILSGHEDAVNHAAFSPGGRQIVTASSDGTARVWDAATGLVMAVLSGHRGRVFRAAFSPDGLSVVTASGDKTARIWNVMPAATRMVLQGHNDWVVIAAFSPDGTRVVTASKDHTARLWVLVSRNRWFGASRNANPIIQLSGDDCTVLRGHEGGVNAAAFSPDNSHVITASEDETVRLWNEASGAQIALLRGHRGWVRSAVFSTDGALVVTASDDKTARLWDAATGQTIAFLRGHDGQVHSASFSPNSDRVLTASSDRTARLWEVGIGKAIVVLFGHDGEILSAAF